MPAISGNEITKTDSSKAGKIKVENEPDDSLNDQGEYNTEDDDWPFSANTERNLPVELAKADGKLITCRALSTKLEGFSIKDNGQYELLKIDTP